MHISSSLSMSHMMKHAHGHHGHNHKADHSVGERMVAKLDKNGDGGISANELAGSKRGRRMSVEKFDKIDVDNNSQLSAKEINTYADNRRGNRPSFGDRVVNRFDKDNDGGVSIEELAKSRVGRRMSAEKFTSIDTDSDSKLAAAELNAHREAKTARPSIGEAVVAKLDNDGDGGISIEELASTRFGKHMSSETFTNIDTDGDSKLSASEVDAIFEPEKKPPSVGEAMVAKLDNDGDGAVSISELSTTQFGKDMTSEQFSGLDTDGDSKLNAAELDAHFEAEEAAPPPPPPPTIGETVVAKLDGDGDGAVSIHELAGSELGAQMKLGGYAKVDSDGDSKLSAEEITAFMEDKGITAPSAGGDDAGESTTAPVGSTAGILAQIAASQVEAPAEEADDTQEAGDEATTGDTDVDAPPAEPETADAVVDDSGDGAVGDTADTSAPEAAPVVNAVPAGPTSSAPTSTVDDEIASQAAILDSLE